MDMPDKYRLALKSLSDRLNDCINEYIKELEVRRPPEFIYHYTNDAGLRGILESKTLWLTNIFDLNDPSELRHGLTNASARFSTRAKEANQDGLGLADFFDKFVQTGVRETGCFYCCSFSSNGDELGQWRAYADDGRGFALAFDAGGIELDFAREFCGTNSTFPVAYDDEKLSKKLDNLALFASESAGVLDQTCSGMGWVNEYLIEIGAKWSLCAIQAACFFKHEAYGNESEYRFLSRFDVSNRPKDVKYRSRPYSLAEYLEYNWGKKSLGALKKIVIGPAADRATADKFVEDCLRASGFSNGMVKIGHSTIPYRSGTTSK